ncbi:MAG: HD domain-containing protein [Clostridia bacterium]|nr:HD domain-containing protein [Clostridia bacterium]
MKITEGAKSILKKLKSSGYEAYVVGGAVRNSLLGKPYADYDFTTSATPEEILGVFCDCNTFAPGIKHGTVCVEIDGEVYEITSFRSDGEYADSRHPSSVSFVRSLDEDLCRRDFTVNAMCFDGERIIDRLGGREDCRDKIIRAIGDPIRRFEEDALRILRALRFASKLSFKIEEKTKRAIFARKRLLNHISAERIAAELSEILLGENCEEVLLEYAEIICEVIPELAPCIGFDQKNRYHAFDVYGHSVRAVGHTPPVLELRLAALLHDIGKPSTFRMGEDGQGHFYGHARVSGEIANSVLLRLKLRAAVREEVVRLVAFHDYPIVPPESADDDKYLLRSLNKFGEKTLFRILDIKRADNLSKAPFTAARIAEIDALSDRLRALLDKKPCFDISSLAVNGRDMTSLGFKGREVGERLEMLLLAVIEGRVENDREKLIEYVKTT